MFHSFQKVQYIFMINIFFSFKLIKFFKSNINSVEHRNLLQLSQIVIWAIHICTGVFFCWHISPLQTSLKVNCYIKQDWLKPVLGKAHGGLILPYSLVTKAWRVIFGKECNNFISNFQSNDLFFKFKLNCILWDL